MIKLQKIRKRWIFPMSEKPLEIAMESEDQRQASERRTFSYTAHIPERRSGKNRRKKR